MNFSTLPKVELHVHLESSLSFAAVSRIDPSVTLQDYQHDFVAPAKCTNLADYLQRAPKGITLMQTEEELRLVTADVFEQFQQDNVLYAEIRFVPFVHTRKGLSAEKVVEIVEDETVKASQATGIEARLIPATLRHFSAEQSLQTVKLVERFLGTRVAGVDLGASEAGFPIFAHISAFQYAAQKGIPRTAHAGETRGAESVWEVLKCFGPSRIAHGVRSIEDPALIEHLRKEDVHLELCPTSNVQIDIYKTYADHPINRLYKSGVSLSVNTDTRMLANVTLTQEYERLHETFGWDEKDFLQCNLHAVRAAFAPEDVKRRLEKQLREGYGL